MKDTRAIANHLNKLLSLSSQYVYSCGRIDMGHRENDEKLYKRIKPILDAALESCDLMEISQAAKERREANLIRVDVTPTFWRTNIPWKSSQQLWDYCSEQIAAAVDQFNRETMQEYENYRIACEQGVAVAPK